MGSKRPNRRAPTKVLADAMLGSLARKLRAFGFDTVYFKDGDDSELIRLGLSTGRLIISSDRGLVERGLRKGARAFLLTGTDDSERLVSFRRRATDEGYPLVPGDSRCSVCNGELRTVGRHEAAGRVPEASLQRHRLFFACLECGRFYWKGAHWKKLRSLRRRLPA